MISFKQAIGIFLNADLNQKINDINPMSEVFRQMDSQYKRKMFLLTENFPDILTIDSATPIRHDSRPHLIEVRGKYALFAMNQLVENIYDCCEIVQTKKGVKICYPFWYTQGVKIS